MKRKHFIFIISVVIMIAFGVTYSSLFLNNNKTIMDNQTSDVSVASLSSEDHTNSSVPKENLTGKDYYQTNNNPPTEQECKDLKTLIFQGLSDEEIKTVQKYIHEAHMYLESNIVNENLWKRLSNKNSDSWKIWENTGTVNVDGVNILHNRSGQTYIDELEEVKMILGNNSIFITDIEKIQQSMQDAVKNHDVAKLFLFHQMIHDCDYWIVNYPIHFDTVAPPDWEAVNFYYDSLFAFKAGNKR